MSEFRRVGSEAESAAAKYLSDKGFVIVSRNYKSGPSEIDLICLDGDLLVFVEVKKRRKGAWETAEETVSPDKQKRLWQTAENYLADMGEMEREVRFDVIATDGEAFRHYEDAFRPD